MRYFPWEGIHSSNDRQIEYQILKFQKHIDTSRIMDETQALSAFAALSQPTRLDVFRLLVKAGEGGLPAGDISSELEVRQNTMSSNLSILAQSGLITSKRQGRNIRYFANIDGMRGLLGFLLEDCCGGQPDLCQPLIKTIANRT